MTVELIGERKKRNGDKYGEESLVRTPSMDLDGHLSRNEARARLSYQGHRFNISNCSQTLNHL